MKHGNTRKYVYKQTEMEQKIKMNKIKIMYNGARNTCQKWNNSDRYGAANTFQKWNKSNNNSVAYTCQKWNKRKNDEWTLAKNRQIG